MSGSRGPSSSSRRPPRPFEQRNRLLREAQSDVRRPEGVLQPRDRQRVADRVGVELRRGAVEPLAEDDVQRPAPPARPPAGRCPRRSTPRMSAAVLDLPQPPLGEFLRGPLSAADWSPSPLAQTIPAVVPTTPRHEGGERRGRRRSRPRGSGGRTSAPGTRPTAGRPPPARRSGAARCRGPARRPTRSGGCGPSPGTSSRSSRVRRGPAASAGPAPSAAAPPGRQPSAGRRQPRARPRRLLLADHPQRLDERRPSGAAPRPAAVVPVSSSYSSTPRPYTSVRVSTSSGVQLGLLGAHVLRACRRPSRRRCGTCSSVSGWPDRLGDAEVDDLRHRPAVLDADQDVRRLEVAVDDALLVGVLHGAAHRHEQFQPLADGQVASARWSGSERQIRSPIIGPPLHSATALWTCGAHRRHTPGSARVRARDRRAGCPRAPQARAPGRPA